MFNLFSKTFVITLTFLRLYCLMRLCQIKLTSLKYKIELNCKHNRNPSITKLIDHAQLHVKIA